MKLDILKKIQHNTVFRNGIFFSFFSFLNSGINFLLLLILANFIPPSEYGELNLFNTFTTLFAVFISLNATGIIAVDFFRVGKVQLQRILSTVLCLSSISFFLFSFFLLIFPSFFKQIVGLPIQYQWIGLLICYLQVFSTINLDIWRLEEKTFSYGVYSISIVLGNFLLTLILVICFHWGWLGRIYAQMIISLIFFTISIYFLTKREYLKKITPTSQTIKSALSFGLPLIPHATSSWIRQGLDRYIINFFYATTQVGVYSFAYNFANIIHIIGLAFNATNSVYIYKSLSNQKPETATLLLKQTKTMTLFFAVITFFIYIGSYIFIPIFVPKYVQSLPFLLPLCIGSFFQCVYYLFVNYLFYYKRTRNLMYITFSISILHAILSIWLTRYSIMYTAYLTMAINFLITICVFLYSRRIYKLR